MHGDRPSLQRHHTSATRFSYLDTSAMMCRNLPASIVTLVSRAVFIRYPLFQRLLHIVKSMAQSPFPLCRY